MLIAYISLVERKFLKFGLRRDDNSFLEENAMVLNDNAKSIPWFNYLNFYAFDNLITGKLDSHGLLLAFILN